MYRHQVEDLEERFTDYAAIALATAAIEQVLSAAREEPEVRALLEKLVDDLWSWQTAEKLHDNEDMSEEQTKALPSFQFYSRIDKLVELRDQHGGQSRIHALLCGSIELLYFIVWMMDGVERLLNRGKPFVVGEEVEDKDWKALANGLEWLAKAAGDPDCAYQWQEDAIERLADDYSGNADEEVLGEPVERYYF